MAASTPKLYTCRVWAFTGEISMNYLCKLEQDYGRHGDVEGLFVLTDKELDYLRGHGEVCFGEVLGKHSCVTVSMDEKTLKIVSEDQAFIDQLIAVVGSDHISGLNPLNYIDQFEDGGP